MKLYSIVLGLLIPFSVSAYAYADEPAKYLTCSHSGDLWTIPLVRSGDTFTTGDYVWEVEGEPLIHFSATQLLEGPNKDIPWRKYVSFYAICGSKKPDTYSSRCQRPGQRWLTVGPQNPGEVGYAGPEPTQFDVRIDSIRIACQLK